MLGARSLGLIAAVASFAIDQATKLWLLDGFGLAERSPVRVAPVLDLILAWNPGISFSLFQAQSAAGRMLLNAMTLLAVLLLLLWLLRARTRITGVALGLLIGGALGNVSDRMAYGAVVDFVSFHVGHFYWYIFNGADCAITLGVILLLVEWIRPPVTHHAAKMP